MPPPITTTSNGSAPKAANASSRAITTDTLRPRGAPKAAPGAHLRGQNRHRCCARVVGSIAGRRLPCLRRRPTLPMPLARDATIERRKDYERRAMVDVALVLAELDASWGDYNYALEHLDSANDLTGGALTSRWAARRRRWADAASGFTH